MQMATSMASMSAMQKANSDAKSAGMSEVDVKKARKTAEDFEAVFISQMIQPMFETVKTDSLTGGGPGEDMFRNLMVTEMGKGIARSGGIGIADKVFAEIIKMQEAQ